MRVGSGIYRGLQRYWCGVSRIRGFPDAAVGRRCGLCGQYCRGSCLGGRMRHGCCRGGIRYGWGAGRQCRVCALAHSAQKKAAVFLLGAFYPFRTVLRSGPADRSADCPAGNFGSVLLPVYSGRCQRYGGCGVCCRRGGRKGLRFPEAGGICVYAGYIGIRCPKQRRRRIWPLPDGFGFGDSLRRGRRTAYRGARLFVWRRSGSVFLRGRPSHSQRA